MNKLRTGNKENSHLNGEWGHHVRKFMKRFTSKRRRNEGKKMINKNLNN